METLYKIRDIYLAVHEYETAFLAQSGLSLNEGVLICFLESGNKLSSGEIAEKLCLTHPTASKVIKSVENKGLIKRVLGNKDKRQMYFSLTDKGNEHLWKIKNRTIKMPALLENI